MPYMFENLPHQGLAVLHDAELQVLDTTPFFFLQNSVIDQHPLFTDWSLLMFL